MLSCSKSTSNFFLLFFMLIVCFQSLVLLTYFLYALLFYISSFSYFMHFFSLFFSSSPFVIRYEEWKGDTWIYQLNGSCAVSMNGADRTNSQQLLEGCGGVVPPNTPFELIHETKGKDDGENFCCCCCFLFCCRRLTDFFIFLYFNETQVVFS